jgi:hypothetical protein
MLKAHSGNSLTCYFRGREAAKRRALPAPLRGLDVRDRAGPLMSMLKKIAFAAGAAMFLSAGVAQAQQEATAHEVFNQLKDPSFRQMTEMWLSGVLFGIEHANAALGSRPLYCQSAPIPFWQHISMTERFVALYPTAADWPFGAVMLSAVRQTFPCAGGLQ